MAQSCFDIKRLKAFEADTGDIYRQFGQAPERDPDDEVVYDEEDDDPAREEDIK